MALPGGQRMIRKIPNAKLRGDKAPTNLSRVYWVPSAKGKMNFGGGMMDTKDDTPFRRTCVAGFFTDEQWEAVKAELDDYARACREDGLIAFHDTNLIDSWVDMAASSWKQVIQGLLDRGVLAVEDLQK